METNQAGRTVDESATRFTIVFDGPAVADGAMDVRDLAPSLLALGALCQRANEVLNPDRVVVSVRVEAEIKVGSFDVTCLFDQSIAEQIKGLFGHDRIHDVNELLRFLGISGVSGLSIGLLKLLKALKGKSAKDLPRDSQSNVTININNSVLIVPAEVLRLASDPQVRQNADRLVTPLRREGVDELRFEVRQEIVETLHKDDAAAFEVPRELVAEEQRGPRETESLLTLELITPQFDPKLKWRLESGDLRITASMRDEGFLARVDNREVQFGHGDLLTVRVRMTQTIGTQGKPTMENEIVEVLEYRPAPIQLEIPRVPPRVEPR